MLKRFVSTYSEKFLSRWVVLAFDVVTVMLAFVAATLIRHNFDYQVIDPLVLQQKTVIIGGVYLIFFFYTQSFAGIIRHASVTDAYRILKAGFLSTALVFAVSILLTIWAKDFPLIFSRSILIIHFLTTTFLLIGSRFVVKALYNHISRRFKDKHVRVIVYGAGASGMITKNTLLSDPTKLYEIVAFVDDNPTKAGKNLEGVPVISSEKLFNGLLEKYHVDQVILSIQTLSPSRKKEIIESFLDHDIKVKVVPPVDKWIHGELSTKQIKNVRIEDLLQREPIRLDNVNISRELKDKVILVTGGAGSIGSEIVRQVLHYRPTKLVVLDQAESALYDLQQELVTSQPERFERLEIVVADVTNPVRMRKVFEAFQPQVVFHAAAYKHVPLMEDNPFEAVRVNVRGTKIVADLSVQFAVNKFVFVSTDKAVNPTNVMGATKRTAEIYVQSLSTSPGNNTQFITTRFGNVLGSNGSVIPLFRKQIEKGGPVTLTDMNITRYFMTIPEACNLVLEAGSMGNGGEVYVFDMGDSVRIYDLAKKMIKLSGLVLGKDIEIQITGLRPGEKLYEELLATEENTQPTHHQKIMIALVEPRELGLVNAQMEALLHCLEGTDNFALVRCIKHMVPEFVSNNSIYGSLDMKVVNE